MIMSLSLKEIARMCGLQDPEEFKASAIEQGASPTGRTTRMLIEAVQIVSDGAAVGLFSHSLAYSEGLTARLREMCMTSGFDPNLIQRPTMRGDWLRRKGQPVIYFDDHFYPGNI